MITIHEGKQETIAVVGLDDNQKNKPLDANTQADLTADPAGVVAISPLNNTQFVITFLAAGSCTLTATDKNDQGTVITGSDSCSAVPVPATHLGLVAGPETDIP